MQTMKKILGFLAIAILGGFCSLGGYHLLYNHSAPSVKSFPKSVNMIPTNYTPSVHKLNAVPTSVDLTTAAENTVNSVVHVKNISVRSQVNPMDFIFGNGGSSSIASHFTTDMIVNNNIKVFNFSDANLLTCFANDFGYENIFSKIIEYYGAKGDLLILVSSSGQSKNHLKAAAKAKLKNFFKIVTLTGFKKNNPLSKRGQINFWIDSKKYNHVENSHQVILLSLIDLIKNK